MANDAPRLREFAKECRELARRVDCREDRERLEEMAKSWEQLAKQHRETPA